MKNFMHNKKTRNKVIKTAIVAVVVLFIILCIFSIFNPYSKVGYRTVFVDSKSNTYVNGEDFKYGRYTFNIKTEITPSVASNLHDCSSLFYEGIFNENSESAPTDQNWWPREACEEANNSLRSKANAEKNVKVTYKIKNNTGDVKSFNRDWLTVLSKDGTTIFTAKDTIRLISNGEVSGTLSKRLDSNKEIGGAVVRLPGLVAQTIK